VSGRKGIRYLVRLRGRRGQRSKRAFVTLKGSVLFKDIEQANRAAHVQLANGWREAIIEYLYPDDPSPFTTSHIEVEA
jgi:hypothetical protein